jgi:hypothetical protein
MWYWVPRESPSPASPSFSGRQPFFEALGRLGVELPEVRLLGELLPFPNGFFNGFHAQGRKPLGFPEEMEIGPL